MIFLSFLYFNIIQYNILHIMAVAILIFLLFLEPILSEQYLSWDEYKKMYYTENLTPADDKLREKIYLENLAKIQEHNDKFAKGLVSYRLAVNEFQHLTDEEFEEIYSGTDETIRLLYYDFYQAPKNATIPEAINWKDQGAVTAVKAQNDCGSCYAFGVVGALESLYYIKYKRLVQFSEQQIIDCGRPYGMDGCNGGTLAKAFSYARDVGLTEQEKYPYENATGPCRIQDLPILVKAEHYQYINNYAIRDMEAAIAFNGPVIASILSVPIRALAGTDIFSGDTCTDRKFKNHAVVVVGYNTTADGQKYWIIKNNWGERWGDYGYFYVDSRKDDPCGLTFGAYVTYIQ